MRIRPAWIFVLVLAGSSPAFAAGEHPDAAANDEARAHYKRATAYYNLGEFDKAIAAYKEAYQISSAPPLLFNIAQAYRLLKNYDQALYFYETYLRLEPRAANRSDVEQLIGEVTRLKTPSPEIEASPAPMEKPPSQPAQIAPDRPPAVVESSAPGAAAGRSLKARRLKFGGLTLAAAGGVLLAVAVGFTIEAATATNELDRLSSSGGAWSAHYREVYAAGGRDDAIAIAGYVAGGAAVIAGSVLAVLGLRAARQSLAIAPSGRGVVFSGVLP